MIKKFCFSLCVLMAGLFLVSCRSEGILIVDDASASAGSETGLSGGVDTLPEDESCGEAAESEPALLVHICGAVVNPGVYELAAGSRIYQLIELAGGFTADAAEGYLNLADSLYDGQKVVVPTIGEAADDPYGEAEIPAQTGGASGDSGLVNINTADKAKLMTLPGIGEARALAIIAWRTEHGAFQKTEDIMQVSGIKEAAYEKIKTLITVD